MISSFDDLKMNWLVLKRSVTMFAVVAGIVLPAWALDGPAPFGFAWGPLDRIPTPSFPLKDTNVTVLLYRRDRLQSKEMPDTEVILLDVCKKGRGFDSRRLHHYPQCAAHS